MTKAYVVKKTKNGYEIVDTTVDIAIASYSDKSGADRDCAGLNSQYDRGDLTTDFFGAPGGRGRR